MDASEMEKKAEARRCSEAMRDLLNAFRVQFEDGLRGSGVTLAQLRLLKAVEQHTEGSAASIARLCHVTPQTLHTMLSRAAREGWIVRGSSDRNHRFVTASLTAEGRAVLAQGIELKERIEADLWRDVPLEAMRALRQTLESGLRNLGSPTREPEEATRHPKR